MFSGLITGLEAQLDALKPTMVHGKWKVQQLPQSKRRTDNDTPASIQLILSSEDEQKIVFTHVVRKGNGDDDGVMYAVGFPNTKTVYERMEGATATTPGESTIDVMMEEFDKVDNVIKHIVAAVTGADRT